MQSDTPTVPTTNDAGNQSAPVTNNHVRGSQTNTNIYNPSPMTIGNITGTYYLSIFMYSFLTIKLQVELEVLAVKEVEMEGTGVM